MRSRNTRRGLAAAAALVSTGLVLAGCASSDSGGGKAASGTWPGEGKAECKGLEQLADFGDLTGEEVTVAIWTATVLLIQHYVIDLVAGAALAVAVAALARAYDGARTSTNSH